jgi:hypothetical protein
VDPEATERQFGEQLSIVLGPTPRI